MAIVPFDNVGAVGIVKDLPAHELPPEAWSEGQNVRFADGKAEKFTGESVVYNTSASVTEAIAIDPWWLLTVQTDANYYWLYAGKNHVYAAANNQINNKITRISASATLTATDVLYSSTANIRWNGGVLGGIPIINNGIDPPQMWSPPSISTRLAPLTYDSSAGTTWASAAVTAKVIRPFKNYLIALDVTKGGTHHPYMVKWSHGADIGAVPESWDETDPSKDAGEFNLAQTYGHVLDCLPLRDINIVYKEDAIWGMQYIGGSFIFRFFEISRALGALSRDCATDLLTRHVVFGDSDVVVHDGQTVESIIDRRWRKWLYQNIDTTYFENCFIARNLLKNEVWLCFPEQGTARPFFCTKALVWNFRENTFAVRELSNIAHAREGIVDLLSSIKTWASVSPTTWGGYVGAWGARSFNPSVDKLLLARPEPDSATASPAPKLLLADDTEQFNGVNMQAYVERTGLAFTRLDRLGNPKIDTQSVKYARAVWPRIEANTGTKVNVYVGGQGFVGDAVNWSGPHTFTVGESIKVDVRVTDRLLGVKFETSANVSWKLTGFDLDVDIVGRY